MRAVTIASAFAILGLCLCGCAVYDVASTAADATATVAGAAVDVAGAVVTAPFGHGDKDKKSGD